MTVEDDVLDLIRSLPNDLNDFSTTTEMKFLTVGSVLWACRDEIMYLRRRVKELEDARPDKGKKVRRVQAGVRQP
jgi:hypothetical protein